MARKLPDFYSNIILNSASRGTGFTQFTKSVKAASLVAGKFLLVASPIIAGTLFAKSVREAGRFSKAISELSAITGSTGDDLDFLSRKSLEFGETTVFTAIEVAGAYKLIASAKPDLLDNLDALTETTRQTLLLAEASGVDLPQAAMIVGQALNQFGEGADQAGRFVNVMAAGAKRGSSEVENTGIALVKAGVVAKRAGTSFEEFNAALQTLAKGGLLGEEAGTALRGAYLRLAKQSNEQFKPAVVGLTQAFKNLNEANLSDEQLIDLFGQRVYVAGGILLDGTDILAAYTAELTGTNVALEQAARRTDNLEGDITLLGSAWKSLTIQVGQGGEALGRQTVQNVSDLTAALARQFDAVEDADGGWSWWEGTLDAVSISVLALVAVLQQLGTGFSGLFSILRAGIQDDTGEGFFVSMFAEADIVEAQLDSIAEAFADSAEKIATNNRASVSTFDERVAAGIAATKAYQDSVAAEVTTGEELGKQKDQLLDEDKKRILAVVQATEKAALTQTERVRASYDAQHDILLYGYEEWEGMEERTGAAIIANRTALGIALAEIGEAERVREAEALESQLQSVLQAGLTEEEVLRAQLDRNLITIRKANNAKTLSNAEFYAEQKRLYAEYNLSVDELEAARALTEEEQLLKLLEGTSLGLELKRNIELAAQEIDMELYLAHLETKELTDEEYEALRAEKREAHRQRLSDIDQKGNMRDLKMARDAGRRELQYEAAKERLKGALWRGAIQAAGKYGKALFLVQQGLAISKGIVDTHTAALDVFATTPGTLIAKTAAKLTALKLGYTQVGLIAAQTAFSSSFGGGGGGGGGGGTPSVAATRESLRCWRRTTRRGNWRGRSPSISRGCRRMGWCLRRWFGN